MPQTEAEVSLESRYRLRNSNHWRDRLIRVLEPPVPYMLNPAEPKDFPLGRWNLYLGGPAGPFSVILMSTWSVFRVLT